MVDTKDEGVLVNNGVEDDKDDEHFGCGRDDDDENVDWVGSRSSSGEVRVFTQFFGNFHSVFFVICTQSFFVIFTRSFFCHFHSVLSFQSLTQVERVPQGSSSGEA